ncbi:MAG: hypothetical protein M1298_05105 [Chloroflexi bacterium]|nr:hypothetical protein [Chloroflexota bacterium]
MNKRMIFSALIASGSVLALSLPNIALAAPAPVGTASNPIALTSSYSGALSANSGGSFDYFQVPYGATTPVTLNLTLANGTAMENGAAGFAVYVGGVQVGTSTPTSPTNATLTFSESSSGTATVQLYDYDPVYGLNFTLSASGVAAPPSSTAATSTISSTPASAQPTVTPLAGSVSGNLAGNTGGSYRLYSVNYMDSSQALTITMTASPSIAVAQGAAGFNVYDASGNLVGTATLQSDGSLALTLSGNPTGVYTVQVYDYAPTNPTSYTLTTSVS